MQAEDITVLDLRNISEVTDFFVICTVGSPRQLRALYFSLRKALKERGEMPLGQEGLDTGSWVLCDYNDVIIHIFTSKYREFYDLELLWGDAPRIEWQNEKTA